MLRRFILCFISIITLSLSFGQGLAQALQSKLAYRYGYFTFETKIGTLHLTDPASPQTQDVLALPIQEDEFASRTDYSRVLSPDGQWISFIVAPLSNDADLGVKSGQIRLLNVLTGEVRNGPPRMVFNDIAWSPDNRYLAINMNDDEFSHVKYGTAIYDLQTDMLNYVLEADRYRYGLTWSPDSTHLAVESSDCIQGICEGSIDVITVPLFKTVLSVPYDKVGDRLCQSHWSPDNHYLSFVYSCYTYSPYINDLFILDIATSQIKQLTTFTQPLDVFLNSKEPATRFYNIYDSFWYSADELFVGISSGAYEDGIGYDPATIQVTTNAYRMDGSTRTISDEMLNNWARNPVDSTIVFRAEKKTLGTDDFNMKQLLNAFTSVQVANFSNGEFQPSYNQPVMGCDLSWSPDGVYLAYGQYTKSDTDCFPDPNSSLERFSFLNVITQQTSEIPISGVYPSSLGWIAVPAGK